MLRLLGRDIPGNDHALHIIRQKAAVPRMDVVKKDRRIKTVAFGDILRANHNAAAGDLLGRRLAGFLERDQQRNVHLGHGFQELVDPAIRPRTADILGLGDKISIRRGKL